MKLTYQKMDAPRGTYFAGANGGRGFRGVYEDVADERKRSFVYIIKGGPGTGKSTFLRRVADAAEGRGMSVERYLCGSDPESLDAVVLEGRVAVLDGTAPHAREMTFPGASSALLDFSGFWDSAALAEQRDAIVAHSERKSACWASAYRYLRAADAIGNERAFLAERMFDRAKADAYITRLLKKIGRPAPSESGHARVCYTRAVTMRGLYALPTFEYAETVFAVADVLSLALPFLRLLTDRLVAAGHDTVVSHDPVTDRPDGIFLPEKSVAIVTAPRAEGQKSINMARFALDSASRGELRLSEKLESSCIRAATLALARAAEDHFILEEIYKSAMNFPALGRYTKKRIPEILECAGG